VVKPWVGCEGEPGWIAFSKFKFAYRVRRVAERVAQGRKSLVVVEPSLGVGVATGGYGHA
jgi:hypothetical protein